ncbi:MAG: DUF427 domain-containing protein [Pseudomonadota bacterium]
MTDLDLAVDTGQDGFFAQSKDMRVSVEPRLMRVAHAMNLIAETTCARRLEEAGRPTLLFAPRCDVKMEHLEANGKVTFSASKGRMKHLTLKVRGLEIEDAAFEIDQPLGECAQLVNHVCFDQAKIDTISVRPAGG